jgi:hypothetical protein
LQTFLKNQKDMKFFNQNDNQLFSSKNLLKQTINFQKSKYQKSKILHQIKDEGILK